jgi:hypothetical protein
MAKKPVELSNGRRWPTQGAAIRHFMELRDRHPLYTPIEDPDDHEDLVALLERYDASILDDPLKAGQGIRHFETRINEAHGGKTTGFWVVRDDGSETDFSFYKAVAARSMTQAEQFTDACRSAVDEDMAAAKLRYFADHEGGDQRVTCPVTGMRLRRSETRADYTLTPFRELAQQFRDAQGWDMDTAAAAVTRAADAQTTATFCDPNVADAFRRYHHSRAKVRVVSKSTTPTQARADAGDDTPILIF